LAFVDHWKTRFGLKFGLQTAMFRVANHGVIDTRPEATSVIKLSPMHHLSIFAPGGTSVASH
jgi:hypothetical protein